MTESDVGFCKPPIHSRWKPGQSGNLKGRAVRKSTPLAAKINEVMESRTKYSERGKTKSATWSELSLRMLVDRAASGDLGAIDDVLKVYLRAARHSGGGSRVLVIRNWLPDFPDQTAEEKDKAVRDGRHAEPA